ncbi:MAG TPA: hypothetical protein VM422_11455 [Amaricoccus sp.]|nr:hypothetical protein [Amaricoccus sp.]
MAALLSVRETFPAALADDGDFRAALGDAYARLADRGARMAVGTLAA